VNHQARAIAAPDGFYILLSQMPLHAADFHCAAQAVHPVNLELKI
jgi:hypothetical protein